MADAAPILKAVPPAHKDLKKVARPVAHIPPTTKAGVVSAEYVSEATWDAASKEYLAGGHSLRDVAAKYNVCYKTLHRRIQSKSTKVTVHGPAPAFMAELEADIASALDFLCTAGMAMSMAIFKGLNRQIANEFGIETNISRELIDGFFRRHPDLRRSRAEIMEESRSIYFTAERVGDWFDRLGPALAGVHPSKIYSTDECGVDVAKTKSRGKVITGTLHPRAPASGCVVLLAQLSPPWLLQWPPTSPSALI